MNYKDLLSKLKSNHFYADIQTVLEKKGERITGLRIDCSSLLKYDKQNRLEEIVGDEFNVTYLPNEGNEYFLIQKK